MSTLSLQKGNSNLNEILNNFLDKQKQLTELFIYLINSTSDIINIKEIETIAKSSKLDDKYKKEILSAYATKVMEKNFKNAKNMKLAPKESLE